MKNIDIQKWVNEFKDLEADNQLKIVEEIIKELHLNEEVLGEYGYDVVKSSSLKQALEDYIFKLTYKPKIGKIRSLLDRFDKLDKNHKISLIENLLKPFEEELEKQERSQLLCNCKKEGHIWSPWKKGTETKEGIYCPPDITDYSSPFRGQPYWYDVPIWIRTCERCGCEETRDYEDVPDEIIEKRKQDKIKRNKQKIKRLQEVNKKLEDKK